MPRLLTSDSFRLLCPEGRVGGEIAKQMQQPWAKILYDTWCEITYIID